MKCLMGLILSFALGGAAMAQDNTTNDNCDDATSSAKFRQKKETSLSDESQTTGKSEVMYGESGQDFTKMERVDENGSVYYFDDPSVKEESMETKPSEKSSYSYKEFTEDLTSDEGTDTKESDMNSQNENLNSSDQNAKMEASTKGGSLGVVNECGLNGLIDDQTQSHYKYKEELDNGADLKVEREKDGEGKVKYESDNEYYYYERNEKGKTQSYHGLANENEAVDVYKNKDGSVDVFYQGHFNNMDEARAIENGIQFEGVESVCNQ